MTALVIALAALIVTVALTANLRAVRATTAAVDALRAEQAQRALDFMCDENRAARWSK